MKYEKLYIWGPNPLNNRLLARHIHSFSGITPSCITESTELTENAVTPTSLFFCDCDKTEAKFYCRKIFRHGFTHRESPSIVLLNVTRDKDLVDEIKTYSIQGIFYASDQFDLIEKGIRKMLGGEYWFSRDVLVKSLRSVRESESERKELPISSQLTLREQEILWLISAGLSNQAVADRLFISPNTVKTHISNIYKKIDSTNRVQAINWAAVYLQFPRLTSEQEGQRADQQVFEATSLTGGTRK